MKIGIIGTGNMGRSLGLVWAELGHEVFLGSVIADRRNKRQLWLATRKFRPAMARIRKRPALETYYCTRRVACHLRRCWAQTTLLCWLVKP
jgi:predicted dinucleotide-binding enzyme